MRAKSSKYDGRLGKKHALWDKINSIKIQEPTHICEMFRDPKVWGMLGQCLNNKGKIIISHNFHCQTRNSVNWQASVCPKDSIFHLKILFWTIFQVTQRHISLRWTQRKKQLCVRSRLRYGVLVLGPKFVADPMTIEGSVLGKRYSVDLMTSSGWIITI